MNPYYAPEKMGLEILATIEDEPNWDFDIMAIWTDGSRLYWANDSGCSCPTPFEDYNNLESLSSGDVSACLRAIDDFTEGEHYYHNSSRVRNQATRAKELVREWGSK